MMTDEQQSKVAELKAAIAASTPTAGGAPQRVRTAVLTLKKELRGAGTTARELAAALGIHETTLCRWERDGVMRRGATGSSAKKERGRGAGFRMVRVASPAWSSGSAAPSGSLRVAHAPSGLVVDGLDVESLALLLRRMS